MAAMLKAGCMCVTPLRWRGVKCKVWIECGIRSFTHAAPATVMVHDCHQQLTLLHAFPPHFFHTRW